VPAPDNHQVWVVVLTHLIQPGMDVS
jgi:hypothetical protein